MELEFTTWERAMLVIALGAGEGTIAVIRDGNWLIDLLEFSDSEKRAIDYSEVTPGNFRWSEKGETWRIQIPDRLMPLVKGWVAAYQRWPNARLADVERLFMKLGIPVPKEGDENDGRSTID